MLAGHVAACGTPRAVLVACVLGLRLAAAGNAQAQPALDLHVQAPLDQGCPSTAAIRERVLAERSGPVRPLSARLLIQRSPGGVFQLSLATEQQGDVGRRELRGSSCEAVVQAAAVVLVWLMDPETSGESTTLAAPIAPVASVKPRPPAPDGAPSPATLRAQTWPFVWQLRAGGAFSAGLLPLPGWAVGGALGLRVGRWDLLAEAEHSPAERIAVDRPGAPTERGASLALSSLGVAACFNLSSWRPLSVAPCAGVELEYLRGRGFGVSQPASGGHAWAAATLGVETRVPLSEAWFVSAQGTGVLSSEVPRFVLGSGIGQVYQVPRISPRLGVALGFSL